MRTETIAWMLGAAAMVLSTTAACGGRATATVGDGGEALGVGASSGGNASGSNGGGTVGSSGGAGVTCTQSMGGGSSGANSCEVSSAGTCSDGTEYDINCSCPAGTCTCSKQTTSSGTQTSQATVACPEACSQGAWNSLLQACNFGAGQGSVAPAADAGLPACTIPASMQPPSQPGAWSVGRALLDCSGDGINTICVSSDGVTCPNDPVTVGGSCSDECAPDEYVVGFGGPPTFIGDAGYLTPPLLASCNGGTGLPSGTSFVCCPCQ